mgnify:CR=1 FL=1
MQKEEYRAKLLEELVNLSKQLNKIPTKKDMMTSTNEFTKKIHSYYDEFGTLENAKKLAGLIPGSPTEKATKPFCRDCFVFINNNKTLCDKCLNLARERENRKRNKNIQSGLCAACGLVAPMKDKKLCSGCFDKAAKRAQLLKQSRLDNKLCVRCGLTTTNVNCWHNTNCARCHLKYKFKFNTSYNNAAKIINTLLENQNYKCVLSGRSLKDNKYHIDHIIPRSTRPDLFSEVDNWQLIIETANVFKSSLSMQEIVNLAIDISNNFNNTKI